jgi:hypothetical protein
MMLLIKNRNKFPISVRHFQSLKGICIGGCVDKKNIILNGNAHAHCQNGDKFQGWICFHHKWQLETNTLQHEVAHLLINKGRTVPWHGKKWFYKFIEIGGHDPVYIQKLKRWYPWLKKYRIEI